MVTLLPVCVVLLYVDLLCYVCYVPDVCRSVHTVFCLITTIIVILFKENVNLFRPTSYDMIRHLSENTTTKKLLFLTITVGTTVFFHHFLCSADNPVQFHKIYYRLFSNVLLAVIYKKKGCSIKFLPVTFRPRQGGVNSINMKKICKIGKQAVIDFVKLNRIIRRT